MFFSLRKPRMVLTSTCLPSKLHQTTVVCAATGGPLTRSRYASGIWVFTGDSFRCVIPLSESGVLPQKHEQARRKSSTQSLEPWYFYLLAVFIPGGTKTL